MNRRTVSVPVSALLAAALLWNLPSPSAAPAPSMRLTFLPLPHASATLIELPGGMKMLDGTGEAGDAPELLRQLKRRQVTSLDALLLSSWTQGSVGGAASLLGSIPVKRAFANPIFADGERNNAVREKLRNLERAGKLQLASPPPGDQWTVFYTPPCQMRALAPFGSMFRRFQGDPYCSLVLEISFDRISYLGLGQMAHKHQQVLWKEADPKPEGEILAIGRNGDTESLLPSVLKPLKTRVAVIPIGRLSRKKPAAATLAALGKAGARVYRTDTQGAVTVTTDGRNVKVTTGG